MGSRDTEANLRPFTMQDLSELVRARTGPCVSLYMPTHRRPDGANTDRIRFKNLVTTARSELAGIGGKRVASRILGPVAALEGAPLWRTCLDGIALFAAPAYSVWFLLPMDLPERCVVGDSFHVRPLVRFLQTRRRFHVLTLSRNGCRLFHGTSRELVAHPASGMPAGIGAVVAMPSDREGLAAHRTGSGRVRFHGDAAPRSEREDLARYFRAVDACVTHALRDEAAPLVIAGVERFAAIYRSVSRAPNLAAQSVRGNFDRTPPETLHARVWPVAEAAIRSREDEAVGAYRAASGSALATDEIQTIAQGASRGRVRLLLLARGRSVGGTYDPESGSVTVERKSRGTASEDVLDDIAEAVLLRGGEALVVEAERMPSKAAAAAVLRW